MNSLTLSKIYLLQSTDINLGNIEHEMHSLQASYSGFVGGPFTMVMSVDPSFTEEAYGQTRMGKSNLQKRNKLLKTKQQYKRS